MACINLTGYAQQFNLQIELDNNTFKIIANPPGANDLTLYVLNFSEGT